MAMITTAGTISKAESLSASKDMSVLYVSYSDIDQLKTAKLKLEANEKMLEIAISSQKMLFWTYDLDTRTVVSEFSSHGKVGLPSVIHDVPESLVEKGAVLSDGAEAFLQMYRNISNGAASAESEYKGRNYNDGSASWNHSVLTRLPDHDGKRIAIGFARDISLEMDNLLKYENEFKLRQHLISNSFRYIRVNLSSQMVEELHVNGGESFPRQVPFVVDDDVINFVLDEIPQDYCTKFRDAFSIQSLVMAFSDGKSAVSLEYPRVIDSKTGEIHWFRSEASLSLRPDGNIEAFIHSDDIEWEKKNKLAIDSIANEEIESILIVSRITKLVHFVKFNGRMIAESGVPFKSYLESEVYPLIVPEDKKRGKNFFDLDALVLRLKKSDSVELFYSLARKTACRKKIRAFFLDDSKQDVVFVKRDVTAEYNKAESRHRALAKALHAANEANRAKSEFISRMSHDIRTPLNAIINLSGSHMQDEADAVMKTQYITDIHEAGEYLLGIINDVLDMSRIDNGKLVLSPSPYHRDELLAVIQSIIGEQCKVKGQVFVCDFDSNLPECIMVDHVRLNQILVNLLSNAIKFTPRGGTVTFIGKMLSCSDGYVTFRFSVCDTGIGMSKEFQAHAFESFTQEQRDGNTQGTGLGLAIVKTLVRLMNGKIELHSEIDKGTRFDVQLNLPLAPDNPGLKTPVECRTIAGLRILLCEDNALNAKICTNLLQSEGCIVDIASNGKEGG